MGYFTASVPPYDITTAGLDFIAPNDDQLIQVDIGFNVRVGNFYGRTIWLSNNGWFMFSMNNPSGIVQTFTGSTPTWRPTNMADLQDPMFAGLWYDVDTRVAGSGTCHYGTLNVNGRQAFRAVWNHVGVYPLEPKFSTFAMTIYNVGSKGYWMESRVGAVDVWDWYFGNTYPSTQVTVGLSLGMGIVDRQWIGKANIANGLYVFKNGGNRFIRNRQTNVVRNRQQTLTQPRNRTTIFGV